jgi:proteasome lid subunit RPN8/RPN11
MTSQPLAPKAIKTCVVLSDKERESIQLSSAHSYPNEFCGILLGRKSRDAVTIEQIVVAPNVAPAAARHDRYEINPGLLIAWENEAEKVGLQIVGLVHSYPDHVAEPSEEDLAKAWPGYVYLVASIGADKIVSDLCGYQFDDATKAFKRVSIASQC